MKKLSKKAMDQLTKGTGGVPPKGILLQILRDAGRLLTGMSCGALDIKDNETRMDVFKITSMIMTILRDIQDNETAQAELETESEIEFHKVISSMDEDVLTEVLAKYKENEDDEGDADFIEKAAREIKSNQVENKD
tara:strand:+ start:175 stop:582 length:408 start_codon:yes stop_codon:yes gene_type:complete